LAGVGVLWGYGDNEELSNAGASRLLVSPAELLALVSDQYGNTELQADIKTLR
jgi:phosphoglycolate phosphatase-like HAD superfamily hydrolase